MPCVLIVELSVLQKNINKKKDNETRLIQIFFKSTRLIVNGSNEAYACVPPYYFRFKFVF